MSKFQQRHYEAIAQLMQDVADQRGNKESKAEYRERIIGELCTLFASDNPHFKPERFRLACVPGANVRGRRNVGPAMPYVRGGQ
jgi:hypothetical protein